MACSIKIFQRQLLMHQFTISCCHIYLLLSGLFSCVSAAFCFSIHPVFNHLYYNSTLPFFLAVSSPVSSGLFLWWIFLIISYHRPTSCLHTDTHSTRTCNSADCVSVQRFTSLSYMTEMRLSSSTQMLVFVWLVFLV